MLHLESLETFENSMRQPYYLTPILKLIVLNLLFYFYLLGPTLSSSKEVHEVAYLIRLHLKTNWPMTSSASMSFLNFKVQLL